MHVHRIYRYIDIDTCYICIAPNNSENILTHTVSSVTVTPWCQILSQYRKEKKKTELLNVKRGVHIHTVYKICLYSDFFISWYFTCLFYITIDIFGWIIFTVGQGTCPVHCRVFSSLPGLYSLDFHSIAPHIIIKKSL